MDKRYQVFVSSTYADLKEERQKVIQTLMELDCIPAGMELFPAADQQQLEFIKKVIDDCDYYLLIIGGRYGSLTEDGVSYTEREFDYAVSKGMKVVAFLHSDPSLITVGKSDVDAQLREKLNAFCEKVRDGRLVKNWTQADELPGLVALSLTKTMKMFPAVGWVRADSVAKSEVLEEINELRKQNDALRSQQSAPSAYLRVEGLAGLDETFTFHGTCLNSQGTKVKWKSVFTWRKAFSLIAPFITSYENTITVKRKVQSFAFSESTGGGLSPRSPDIDDQDFMTFTIQMRALGLIRVDHLTTSQNTMADFWKLTPAGEALMVQERAIRTAPKD